MRKFNYKDINEMGISGVTGKTCYSHDYERGLLERANHNLIENFNKVANWVAENCPNLNGEFRCAHNPYYWIKLVVENGKAYLEYGSHGYGYSLALSTTETATFSRGSMQSVPYAYDGIQFFRNDYLEEFLKQWTSIKSRILAENGKQSYVFSENFEA